MQSTSSRERPKTPQAVFDRVAPFYDTLNSLLSLGMDRRWRRATVAALGLSPGDVVLDVATGTGALAVEIGRSMSGTVRVTACDTNERMLSVARARTEAMAAIIVRCDASRLPFADESFDAVGLSFAIDDMPDRVACVREIRRVLRAGGRVALLELSQPDGEMLAAGYRAYLRVFRALRRLGYEHLEQEILTYRGATAIEELLGTAGFSSYRRRSLSGGIARLHVARKGHEPS